MVGPHSPLPLPKVRNEDQFELDPVGIDAIIDPLIGFNPVAINITWVRFLRTEATVDKDTFNTGSPKGLDCGAEPLQQPSTTWRKAETIPDLLQRCLMISRWESAGSGVERRNHKLPPFCQG
jgi:hypothetical protein